MKEDLLKIINNYGTINQLKKLNEECYELIEAIRDYEKSDEESCYSYVSVNRLAQEVEHIIEEFADICVVLEQFKAYYNLDNDKIIEIMKYKINRTIDRMNK